MDKIYDENTISSNEEEEGGIVGVSECSPKCSSSFSASSSDSAETSSSSSFDNLSDLISQLPIIHVKKGLSKYYKGKSESFTSLADVTTIKDLVKTRPKHKSCRNRVYSLNVRISSMKATRRTLPSSSHSRIFKPFNNLANQFSET